MTDPRPPFSLVGIDHVVFIVDDLKKATKWYADVLGCQPAIPTRPSAWSRSGAARR